MDNFEDRNKMQDDVLDFVALLEDPKFDPLDTPEHQDMMLNIIMFRMNLSAYSINPLKVLKFVLFRKHYMKKMNVETGKGVEFLLNIIMMVQKRDQYIVPLVWHDVMVEVFKEKEENGNESI